MKKLKVKQLGDTFIFNEDYLLMVPEELLINNNMYYWHNEDLMYYGTEDEDLASYDVDILKEMRKKNEL